MSLSIIADEERGPVYWEISMSRRRLIQKRALSEQICTQFAVLGTEAPGRTQSNTTSTLWKLPGQYLPRLTVHEPWSISRSVWPEICVKLTRNCVKVMQKPIVKIIIINNNMNTYSAPVSTTSDAHGARKKHKINKKAAVKKWVLRASLNLWTEDMLGILRGRLFQSKGPACGWSKTSGRIVTGN